MELIDGTGRDIGIYLLDYKKDHQRLAFVLTITRKQPIETPSK
jgi:hypothetical protein